MCGTNLLLSICYVTSVSDVTFHTNLTHICGYVTLRLLQSVAYCETHHYVQNILGRTSETVILLRRVWSCVGDSGRLSETVVVRRRQWSFIGDCGRKAETVVVYLRLWS